MDRPTIMLSTTGRGSFTYADGYSHVSTQELEELLQLSQEMLASMEAELIVRKVPVVEALPVAIKTCIEKLKANSVTLRVLERLDDSANLASSAAQILRSDGSDRRAQIYKRFLQDVLEQLGGGMVVLCSSSLGKRRIVDLKNTDRISLLGYLKGHRNSFSHAILDETAMRLGIIDLSRTSSSEVHEPEHQSSTAPTTTSPAAMEREIEYKYSEAHVDEVLSLGPDLACAIRASKQWMWERNTGGLTTDCIGAFSRKNRGDMTLQIVAWMQGGDGHRGATANAIYMNATYALTIRTSWCFGTCPVA